MKYLYCVIFVCFTASPGMAQRKPAAVESPTFVVGALYDSNASYYGQSSDDKLPYVLTSASVRFPGGLWLSTSAYKLLNVGGSGISAVDAGIGLELNLNKSKSLTGDISYAHSFYPPNSPFIQSVSGNLVSARVNYAWTLFNSAFSADYAFGQESDFFATFSNSRSIELGSFSNDDLISFDPTVEVVAGTQHFYETYTTKKKQNGKGKKGKGGNTVTTTVEKSSFDLLSYNLKLPLSYNRTNYMIEASYQLSILGDKVETVSNKPGSFFNLGFYYSF